MSEHLTVSFEFEGLERSDDLRRLVIKIANNQNILDELLSAPQVKYYKTDWHNNITIAWALNSKDLQRNFIGHIVRYACQVIDESTNFKVVSQASDIIDYLPDGFAKID